MNYSYINVDNYVVSGKQILHDFLKIACSKNQMRCAYNIIVNLLCIFVKITYNLILNLK
jgi:hypothetical protein